MANFSNWMSTVPSVPELSSRVTFFRFFPLARSEGFSTWNSPSSLSYWSTYCYSSPIGQHIVTGQFLAPLLVKILLQDIPGSPICQHFVTGHFLALLLVNILLQTISYLPYWSTVVYIVQNFYLFI
jgi:hypothetical protein